MQFKHVLANLVLAALTAFTGLFGQLCARLVRWNFRGEAWMYKPWYWLPGISTVPAAYIAAGKLG